MENQGDVYALSGRVCMRQGYKGRSAQFEKDTALLLKLEATVNARLCTGSGA